VRVAVVTGAASGIGRACAELLGASGAHVVVADIDEPGGLDTAAAIDSAEFVPLDVSSPAAVERELGAIAERHGRLDILVNCAGIVSGQPDFPDTPLDRVEQLIAVNVTGTIAATQVAMRAMGGDGVVVNISSTAALAAAHPDPVYAASKAAVKTFTEQCAPLAATYGVRVNAVLPGAVDTPIIAKTGDGGAPASWLAPRLQTVELLSPGAIAAAVLELVEDDATSGAAVVVDNA
jgi:NAD(P)-dependent dehydrogenase (short-subunit alcohol dehydrogenase family)